MGFWQDSCRICILRLQKKSKAQTATSSLNIQDCNHTDELSHVLVREPDVVVLCSRTADTTRIPCASELTVNWEMGSVGSTELEDSTFHYMKEKPKVFCIYCGMSTHSTQYRSSDIYISSSRSFLWQLAHFFSIAYASSLLKASA